MTVWYTCWPGLVLFQQFLRYRWPAEIEETAEDNALEMNVAIY